MTPSVRLLTATSAVSTLLLRRQPQGPCTSHRQASHLGCAEGPSRYRSLGHPTGSQRPRCTWELSTFQQGRQQRGRESPSDTTLPCTFLGWAPPTLRVADRKGALGHLLSPACGAAAGSLACQASPTEQVGRAALRGTSSPFPPAGSSDASPGRQVGSR